MPKSKDHFEVYNNPFFILKLNTPNPLVHHGKYRKEHDVQNKHNLTKFKLQEIPPYVHMKEYMPQDNIQQ